MMQIWEPSRCFCYSLRTGSLVVGSLALIGAIFNLINSCIGTYAFVINWLARIKLISCLKEEDTELCDVQAYGYVIGICIALLVVEGIQALFSSMLIHGIRKDRPKLMLPSMAWSAVRLCLLLMCSVFTIVVYFSMPEILMLLFIWIILAVVECLCVLVHRAQYFKMKQDLSESHVMLEEEYADI